MFIENEEDEYQYRYNGFPILIAYSTPLLFYTAQQHFMMKYMIKCKAMLNIQNPYDKDVSLHILHWFNQVKMMQIFVKHGANIFIKNNQNKTCLFSNKLFTDVINCVEIDLFLQILI